MTGAIMNPINIRLEPDTIAYILDHCETKFLFVDCELAPVIKKVLELLPKGQDITIIDIYDG